MKKTFVVLAVAALTILSAFAYSDHRSVEIGVAKLQSINDSGIRGRVLFIDDGSTLLVAGSARGLDPATTYTSLIYDNGSVATGPTACEPTIFDPSDPDFILPTMFIGTWTVKPNGRGTLIAKNTNGGLDYVPLGKFKTISIRDTSINGGFGPDAVVACGEERTLSKR